MAFHQLRESKSDTRIRMEPKCKLNNEITLVPYGITRYILPLSVGNCRPVSRTHSEKRKITADLVCHQCADSSKQGKIGKPRPEELSHISVNRIDTYVDEPTSYELRETS